MILAFEEMAINSVPLKPEHWFRFLDDTHFIWTHERKNLNIFFEHMNNQSDYIKFTMKVENTRSFHYGMFPSLIKSTGKRLTLIGTYKPILTTILLKK